MTDKTKGNLSLCMMLLWAATIIGLFIACMFESVSDKARIRELESRVRELEGK